MRSTEVRGGGGGGGGASLGELGEWEHNNNNIWLVLVLNTYMSFDSALEFFSLYEYFQSKISCINTDLNQLIGL